MIRWYYECIASLIIAQDLFLDILESAATKREAKAYLSRFTPQKSALSSLSALPSIDKEVGVNLGNLYRPMRSMDEKPVLSDTPAQPSLTKEPVELLHVALVKIRAPQSIQDETLQCVSHTLSQLARLGLSCVVVVDIEDGQDRSDSEGRKLAIEQAKRIVDAVDIFGGPGARFVDTVIGISPVREQLQPLVRVRGGIRITHRNLLLGPLRGGIIPVVAPIGFAVDTQKLVPVVADEVVLALTRDFAGIHIQPLAEDDPNAIAEEITSLQNQISLDRVIVLDPLGGIPSTDSIHGSHVFINIEQEFDAIKKDLLGTNDRTFSLAKTSRSDLPGTDSANAFELSDPFSKVLASESRTAEHPAQEHTTLAKATSRRLSMGFHVKNLELLRSSLALLPPSSSAFLTTPEAVANSRSRPPKASRGPRVRTRRQRNPLIHNLLTDKPVFSSSLPAHRSAIIVARTSMPVTSSSPATFFKRGMPVGIIPDPVEHAWVPPSYLNPPTDLSDSRVDLSRLIHLIDDSFDRTLDVPKYLVRVKDCIAGVIIAGEYEGGAILTWESPPGVSPDKSNRMVPYLDKFAVLKRSQGAGGVADVVFKSMVRDCFPNGVCWRSRMGNPVNKWYFERAIGTWKMPVTNWTMFWTTEGVEKGDEVFKDYEAVCKAVLPTWADKKRTVD